MHKVISIKEGIVRHPDYRFKKNINLDILNGEHIAIVGPNGGGKSLLVDVITGKHALLITSPQYDFTPSKKSHVYENIKYMTFRDSYGEADSTYYYQQRWNQHDIEESPLVSQLLEEARIMADNKDLSPSKDVLSRIFDIFNLTQLLNKRVVTLSSGELRKLQLTKTLISGPRVLIMDNPFIGLDANTRDQLKLLLTELSELTGLLIILVISKSDDLPEFITHVVEVSDRFIHEKETRSQYLSRVSSTNQLGLIDSKKEKILAYPYAQNHEISQEKETLPILDFRNVTIQYGDRTILKNLNWQVYAGERWSLSGDNGSGKSTLLSLVCADNPQAYACDIRLFGTKRGSGESIWDIKKHIGYVSPEMHRAYLKDLPAIEIVASGLHDSIGLYVKPKPNQFSTCEFWMDIFGILGLKDKTFLKLSSGEQRLVLLARAFVKDPELLILDEPLHGLDLNNRKMVKEIINTFANRKNKTIIMVTHYKEELPTCFCKHMFLKRNK